MLRHVRLKHELVQAMAVNSRVGAKRRDKPRLLDHIVLAMPPFLGQRVGQILAMLTGSLAQKSGMSQMCLQRTLQWQVFESRRWDPPVIFQNARWNE